MANPKLSTFILHFSSRSPRATRTHVLIPEGTALPAVGVWRREKSGREITYTLDTSRSIDGYLAWATSARISRVVPARGVEPVELVLGCDRDFFVGYVKPDTYLSLYYKQSDRMITVHVPGPGMFRHVCDGDGQEDFTAE